MNNLIEELQCAAAAERKANADALAWGAMATQPLSSIRLAQLCEMGEVMMRATRRRERALIRANKAVEAFGVEFLI